jgi:hypothetical protein
VGRFIAVSNPWKKDQSNIFIIGSFLLLFSSEEDFEAYSSYFGVGVGVFSRLQEISSTG